MKYIQPVGTCYRVRKALCGTICTGPSRATTDLAQADLLAVEQAGAERAQKAKLVELVGTIPSARSSWTPIAVVGYGIHVFVYHPAAIHLSKNRIYSFGNRSMCLH